jgi:hypothetical protein
MEGHKLVFKPWFVGIPRKSIIVCYLSLSAKANLNHRLCLSRLCSFWLPDFPVLPLPCLLPVPPPSPPVSPGSRSVTTQQRIPANFLNFPQDLTIYLAIPTEIVCRNELFAAFFYKLIEAVVLLRCNFVSF